MGFSGDSVVEKPPANAGDVGSTPGHEDNPLKYSCLENSMDRGVWWSTAHGATKSWTQWSN